MVTVYDVIHFTVEEFVGGVSNRWNGIWNGTVNVCSYS